MIQEGRGGDGENILGGVGPIKNTALISLCTTASGEGGSLQRSTGVYLLCKLLLCRNGSKREGQQSTLSLSNCLRRPWERFPWPAAARLPGTSSGPKDSGTARSICAPMGDNCGPPPAPKSHHTCALNWRKVSSRKLEITFRLPLDRSRHVARTQIMQGKDKRWQLTKGVCLFVTELQLEYQRPTTFTARRQPDKQEGGRTSLFLPLNSMGA